MRVLQILKEGSTLVVQDEQAGRRFVLRKLTPKQLPSVEKDLQGAKDFAAQHLQQVYRVVSFEGAPYLMCEFVEGQNLDELTQDHPARTLPEQLLYDIIDSLSSLHQSGKVHGSLKPSNVIVSSEGKVRLVDFLVSHGDESGLWTSPEQIAATKTTVRSDLFNFGLLICHIFSAEPPFTDETDEKIRWRVLYDSPTLPWHLEGGPHAKWVDIAQKCLQRKPSDRPRSIHAIRRRMNEKKSRTKSSFLKARELCGVLAAGLTLLITMPATGRNNFASKRVLQLVRLGNLNEANREIKKARMGGEESPTLDKLAGDVACASEKIGACMSHYQAALDQDPNLGHDAIVQENILNLLRERRYRKLAIHMTTLLPDQIERLLRKSVSSSEYWLRWNSLRALEARNHEEDSDYVMVYAKDLLPGNRCPTRRTAAFRLKEMGDTKALPYLRDAERSLQHNRRDSECLGDLVSHAIETLSTKSE